MTMMTTDDQVGMSLRDHLCRTGHLPLRLWAYFITFRTCGRNYDAAVIAAGHIGMGLGNGPNTMANEKAVMAEHGFSNVGWVVYPPFGLLVLDIFNPIFCSVIAVPLCRLFESPNGERLPPRSPQSPLNAEGIAGFAKQGFEND
ncbi:MAG: sodium/glutamate symporter [Oscillospiraceae bacterium]